MLQYDYIHPILITELKRGERTARQKHKQPMNDPSDLSGLYPGCKKYHWGRCSMGIVYFVVAAVGLLFGVLSLINYKSEA
jgi:hypothetical protein